MTPDQLQASLQENQANQTAEQGPTLTEGEYNLDEVLSLREINRLLDLGYKTAHKLPPRCILYKYARNLSLSL